MLGSWVRAPRGSQKGQSTHRRPLKIVDFQWSFFYARPLFDAKYWNIRRAWRWQPFQARSLPPFMDLFHYISINCNNTILLTAATSQWGPNGVHQVGFVPDFREDFMVFWNFNIFNILLWCEISTVKKGGKSRWQIGKFGENTMFCHLVTPDISLSSGSCRL